MFYIISSMTLKDIARFSWSCDIYGNLIDNEETQKIYKQMYQLLQPFCLTKDKSDAEVVFELFKTLYKNTKIQLYTLKDREYYKVFPKCWHNRVRVFYSDKYQELMDKELENK